MKTGKYRYVVALLLFVAGAINYMDRAALGVVAPILNKELSLSPSQLGVSIHFHQRAGAAFHR
jgi:MFS transporter, ACS family, hexuronate transporter